MTNQKQAAWQTYRPERAQGNFDAIVVGSGIGGLACAALLAKEGKSVLVLERHYVAGGFTHTFQRGPYEWDVGVHYVGEVHRKNSILRRLFDYISDGNLQWSPMDAVYDRIFFQEGDRDETYDLVAGVQNFKQKLVQYFPEEEKGIDQYIQAVFEVAQATKGFFSARAMPLWLGKIMQPFTVSKFLKYSDRTTYDVVSSFIKNKKLIGLLTSQYGDYGLPPKEGSFAIHALIAKHYFDGGAYPVGGSGQFVETIAPVIEKSGGKILVKAEVSEIVMENQKAIGVKLSNGDVIKAPCVVSDAGVINTIQKMLPLEAQKSSGLGEKLKKVRPSLAHICLYIGLKHTAKELNLPKTNYWIYPGYDHDESIARYVKDPAAALPVTYISFPAAKDPSWEIHHPGTATMEVIGFTPYEWFQKWENTAWQKRGDDYQEYKTQLTERLLQQVYRYVPQVKGKIDVAELSTPLSTKYFCNYDRGEIYGIDHTPERFREDWLRPQTPIKNLFLTGQDIVTDGIGGALFAGLLTASAILKKNVLGNVLQTRR